MSEQKKTRRGFVGVLLLLLFCGGAAMAQTGNLAKIDPELQEQMRHSRDANETFRVIVEMAEQYDNPNLERGTALMTRAQRRDYVVNELKRFSESSQAEVVAFLGEQSTRGQVNVLHRFWIFNGLCCEATADCIGDLSMRHDVRFVALPVEMNITDPIEESNYRGTPPQTGVQWHVSKVRANEVWNYPNTTGFTGTGVVVAIIDSGLNYNHVDISSNLWDGGELYPHHGWDFYNNDNNPIDVTTQYGHGTHVAGIVAGHGSTYRSGVAPGATIMALKVFGDHDSELHKEGPTDDMLCLAIQFALEHGADVLNLSLGADGSGGVSIMRDSFVNVLNAGVVATVSAGNVGNMLNTYPIPNNVGSPGNCPPPWHNPDQVPIGGSSAVICVGATNQNDTLADYSSRGPVTWCQGLEIGDYYDYPYLLHPPVLGGLIRPDVVAPGGEGMNEPGSVWSLQHNSNTEYVGYPGTSMAAPCVAGVIALMLEANPNLTPVKIDSILETTAIPCENLDIKNNFYGAGRVDAYAAVTAALNLNSPQRYHISVAKFPFEDRFEVTGTGHYLADSSCTITASPANRFDRWEKDGDIISTDAIHTIDAVTEDAEYIGFFYEGEIITTAFPTAGGTIEGDGMYHAGDQCTVTATPNPGFAFLGWYSGAFLVSIHPEYTFTVTGDRHLYAHFILANYTVMTSCSPTAGGSVAGGGTYMAGSTVTLTATANSGYVFSCWTEDGQVVSNQPTYSFRAMSDRHLVANFMNLSFSLGTVITNPDGSKGVVFYINPTYTGGCMVALEDVPTTCSWGTSVDVPFVRNFVYTQNECLLSDLDGYANTTVLRDYQSTNTNYAAGKVDYENGWYVPSAGQLRKLYGALPFIETAIMNAGGTLLSDNGYYWSSTEYLESSAWAVSSGFEMYSYSKTSSNKVRAVHDFSVNNTMRIDAWTNDSELGSVMGTGFYTSGSQVTVTATPTGNNLFRGWTEAGHLVSQDPTYTFYANANRKLVANFAIRGGVGTLVNNPDGSQGVLFYLNDDGTEGWMVALEDASESCQWGSNNDVAIMKDLSWNDQKVLRDQNGFYNTWLIRISQGTDNGYAASIVDFDNGWYLPSAGQLRKLYAELPMIEEAIIKAGGSTLTDGKYWSSTEYSASYASTPGFEVSYTSKTTNCRVRAIRNYVPAGDHVVLVAANEDYMGTVSVSGSGVFAQNQTVTVTATPNVGYQFDHWTEDGATVSYDAEYQFPFTRSRSLVAHFVVPGSIGSIVTNADGSRGVVFYTDPSGTGSLIVALEDVSEGCAWGANQDVTPLENLNPNQVQNLLEDQNGYSHTQIIRDWQESNTNYAAGKVDYANDWYLPSAGQLRKLYAVLPLIEEAIVCAGGTLISNNAYWSSSENSSSYAWSPSFEFTKTNKTSNLRVRAIREINMPVNPGIIAQTTPLSQGWNWFSTYIEVEDPLAMLETVEAALGANGQVIKNSEMGTEYDSEWGWFGDLDDVGMTNEQMYKIQVSAPCTLSLEGVPANAAEHPITINPGWNWIGFPSTVPMSLEDAFVGFAQEGDKIRNSAAEIDYDPEWGWFGDFETLVPGQGYMYYSASSVPRTLVFPTGAK